ncbi:MAG: hypothetical protein KGN01_08200, partial [Patescibacteria group bacterium]|nr:hypothetical protein [Patescibacteria group bacterium]
VKQTCELQFLLFTYTRNVKTVLQIAIMPTRSTIESTCFNHCVDYCFELYRYIGNIVKVNDIT